MVTGTINMTILIKLLITSNSNKISVIEKNPHSIYMFPIVIQVT